MLLIPSEKSGLFIYMNLQRWVVSYKSPDWLKKKKDKLDLSWIIFSVEEMMKAGYFENDAWKL